MRFKPMMMGLALSTSVGAWAQLSPNQNSRSPRLGMFAGIPKPMELCLINNQPATDADLMNARQGWIKIVLARRLDLGDIERFVRFKTSGSLKTIEKEDFDGEPNISKLNEGEHEGDRNPFNIYLRPAGFEPPTTSSGRKFVAVQLIIRKRANYKLASLSDLDVKLPNGTIIPTYAVAAASTDNGLMCRSIDSLTAPTTPDADGRQKVKFYIDMSKIDAATDLQSAYNIILQPNDSGETPIIIDPRIWNDG